jgi:hypothetical protein
MTKKPTPKPKTLQWGYDRPVTAEEWILLADDLVSDSLDNMRQMDGDCYMSDYHKIIEFAERLVNAASAIRGELSK